MVMEYQMVKTNVQTKMTPLTVMAMAYLTVLMNSPMIMTMMEYQMIKTNVQTKMTP